MSKTFNPENIETGTFFRNNHRVFIVTGTNGTQIHYDEFNAYGPLGRSLSMSKVIFAQLWKNKNFTLTRMYQSQTRKCWVEKRDMVADAIIGANRYMVKQSYKD